MHLVCTLLKSASESASPKRGAAESAEKVLRPSSLCIAYTEARRPKHFFGTFLGTPFGAGTFRSTFSALLSGRRFGTSVAGRQDCKSRPPSGNFRYQEPKEGINIKNLGRTPPPPPRPPPQGPLTPQILCVWGFFSLQNTGKRPTQRNFEGGVLGAQNSLC